jgi:hypothetical protein
MTKIRNEFHFNLLTIYQADLQFVENYSFAKSMGYSRAYIHHLN